MAYPTLQYWLLPIIGSLEPEERLTLVRRASVPGLDITGGTQFQLSTDTSRLNERGRENALDQTLRILRERLDGIGIIEFDIRRTEGQSIEITVPISADTVMIRRLLTHNGRLTFRLFKDGPEVQRLRERIDAALSQLTQGYSLGQASTGRPFSDRLASLTIDEGIADIVVEEQSYPVVRAMLADTTVQMAIQAFNRANPPAAMFVWAPEPVERNGRRYYPLYVVNRDPDLVGSPLEAAQVSEASQVTADIAPFAVRIQLNDSGREDLTNISSANVGKRLATGLNNRILMTLPIQGRISDGRTEIPGGESIEEARILATALESGMLPLDVTITSNEAVLPMLEGGLDAARHGGQSGLMALLLLMIFFVILYKGSGAVAAFGVAFHLLMTAAILRLFIIAGITPLVTLSSLVSIVLSLVIFAGMHIFLFERIREELQEQNSPRNAITQSFEFMTKILFRTYGILILLSILFIIMGKGPLLDAALTLLAGTAAGLITIQFSTRTLLTTAVDSWNLTKLSI